MSAQPYLFASTPWIEVRDGNTSAMALFLRHYTARQARKIYQFVGPGERCVLLTPDARALFAWRKERYRMDSQHGINCAVFRNEGPARSSALIRAADELAWVQWPGERHFTFVDPNKIKSSNPGYCFIMAGWRPCGYTKSGLRILEVFP